MRAEKGIWLGALLAVGFAIEADGIRFSKELALRAHFHKLGIISHTGDVRVEPVHEIEPSGNKSELQETLDKDAFYQQVPAELHYVNRYPKTAGHFNVREPPPGGSEEEYDEFCERQVQRERVIVCVDHTHDDDDDDDDDVNVACLLKEQLAEYGL